MPSKLSPHSFGPSADLRRLVEAGSPLVVLAGDLEPAQALADLRPGLLLIGRALEPGDLAAEAESGQTPEVSAGQFVERQRAQYARHPAIKVWQGPHAPAFGAAGDPAAMRRMAWYAGFEAERLRLLADLGLRGVVGSFAAGAPDLPMWSAFLPALDAAERHQGYLGLHEYASPFMWSLTGQYQLANCAADSVPGEGDSGWTTLRYRKVYRQCLAPNGLAAVPLIITECGLGQIGLVCPGQSDGGWRNHLDTWARHDGARDPIDYWTTPERDPERYYAEQLRWYDRELQQDAFVVGAAVFTLGGSADWPQHALDGTRVITVLADHIRASHASVAEPARRHEPEAFVVPAGPETRRAPSSRGAASGNALVNAGFEIGRAYYSDETRERAVPEGWDLDYAGQAEALTPGQSGVFGRPITTLINSAAVAPADRRRIFAGGVFCWKVCGTRAPFRVRLWQSLSGLEAGRAYRFTANILPDIVVRAQPRLVYATDPGISEVQLSVELGAERADSGWKTGAETPYGRYSRLTMDFVPVDGQAVVAVEVRCRYPLPLGAWYIDELSVLPV